MIAARNQVAVASGYKIAWEARRFWEQEDHIYGGISWLACGPISLETSGLANVWRPSAGMLSAKGVLIAGYGTPDRSVRTTAVHGGEIRSFARRCRKAPSRPGRGTDQACVRRVVQDPFQPGILFLKPDGRIYFAGDWRSHVNTWREGAALSAQRAAQMIVDRLREA